MTVVGMAYRVRAVLQKCAKETNPPYRKGYETLRGLRNRGRWRIDNEERVQY